MPRAKMESLVFWGQTRHPKINYRMDGKIYERTSPPKKKLMEEILRQLWLVVYPTIHGVYKHRRWWLPNVWTINRPASCNFMFGKNWKTTFSIILVARCFSRRVCFTYIFLKKTYMCTKTSFLLGPSIFTLAVRFRLSTSFLQKTHTFYPMKIDPLQLQIRFV